MTVGNNQPPARHARAARAYGGLVCATLALVGCDGCETRPATTCTEEACEPAAFVDLEPFLTEPGEYTLQMSIAGKQETCRMQLRTDPADADSDCELIHIVGVGEPGPSVGVLAITPDLVTANSKPSDVGPRIAITLSRGGATLGQVDAPLKIALEEPNGPGCGTCVTGRVVLPHDRR